MARPKLNLLSGGPIPGGPMKVGIPAGGPRGVPKDLTATRAMRKSARSKKSYTGTVAGLGRTPHGVRIGSGPKGPGQHTFHGAGVQLPARARGPGIAASVRFKASPPKTPSLMTRIGARLRGGLGL